MNRAFSNGSRVKVAHHGKEKHIRNTIWLVDSGATVHVTNDITVFTSYSPTTGGPDQLVVANGQLVPVMGRGDVHIKTKTGQILILESVEYAPNMTENLLSVPALDEEGYTNSFCQGRYKLFKGTTLVAEAKLHERRYCIEGTLNHTCDKNYLRNITWLVDCGVTFHLVNDFSILSGYNPCPPVMYKCGFLIATDQFLSIEGFGDVHLITNAGVSLILEGVLYVPNALQNVLSVAALDKVGFTSSFGHGRFKISNGSGVIAEVALQQGGYFIEGKLNDCNLNARPGTFRPNSEFIIQEQCLQTWL